MDLSTVGSDFAAMILQLSPALAAKVLEWLKQFEAGPFKALHFPGIKGKIFKWALSVIISGLIAALAQIVGSKVGVDGPTISQGATVGVGAAIAYGIARPKAPKE